MVHIDVAGVVKGPGPGPKHTSTLGTVNNLDILCTLIAHHGKLLYER